MLLRRPSPTAPRLLSSRASIGTLLLAASAAALPAQAQTAGQIGVTGHVAPRCWALLPASLPGALALTAATDTRSSIAARCNHAATPLSVRLREIPQAELPADRRPAEAGSAGQKSGQPDKTDGSAAIEIVLSPTL